MSISKSYTPLALAVQTESSATLIQVRNQIHRAGGAINHHMFPVSSCLCGINKEVTEEQYMLFHNSSTVYSVKDCGLTNLQNYLDHPRTCFFNISLSDLRTDTDY